MQPANNSARQVRFGRAVVDLDRQILRIDGVPAALPHRVFLVLAALIEAEPETVGKADLLQRVWGDEFVDESNLTQAIARLRKLLDPTAQGESHIITVPRLGYRLGVPLQPLAPVVAPSGYRARLAPWAARAVVPSAIAALLLIGAGAFTRVRNMGRPSPPFHGVEPVTGMEGDELSPSLSPDGRTIAFSWTRGTSEPDIYSMDIASHKTTPLATGPEAEIGPAYSPDGSRIAFLRLRLPVAHVVVKHLRGGQEETVAEIPTPHLSEYGSPGPYVAWTPDGESLLFSDRNKASDPVAIYQLRLQDRKKYQLTTPPATAVTGDEDPAVSPDGRTLVFSRNHSFGVSELRKIRLDVNRQGEQTDSVLVSNKKWNRSPAWTRDGKAILYTSGEWGRRRLWKLGMEGAPTAEPLAMIGEDGWHPAISPATGDLYYSRFWSCRHVWRMSLEGPAEPRPLLTSPRLDAHASESPDGNSLVFETRRMGVFEIWRAGADGSNPAPLIGIPDTVVGFPNWSPDGKTLAFDRLVNGERDVFLADATGGNIRRFTSAPGDEVMPSWSADGRHIYFASRRTGRFEVWKQALSGGAAVQVTPNGGYLSQEVEGLPGLYYTRADERQSSLYWLDSTGKEHLLIPSVRQRNFAVAKKGVYFLSGNVGESGVWLFDFARKRVSLVANPPAGAVNVFSVSKDGKRLYYSAQGPRSGDVMVARQTR